MTPPIEILYLVYKISMTPPTGRRATSTCVDDRRVILVRWSVPCVTEPRHDGRIWLSNGFRQGTIDQPLCCLQPVTGLVSNRAGWCGWGRHKSLVLPQEGANAVVATPGRPGRWVNQSVVKCRLVTEPVLLDHYHKDITNIRGYVSLHGSYVNWL